jgi:hypothetical protein
VVARTIILSNVASEAIIETARMVEKIILILHILVMLLNIIIEFS